MSSKRDFMGALVGDALLPFIRRPVEDVLYQTIDDRQIPNRSDFKELRDLANGLRGQLTGATSGVRNLSEQIEAIEVRLEQLEQKIAATPASSPSEPDLDHLMEQMVQRLRDEGWTPPRTETQLCKVPGCEEKSRARGFCARHYQQWRRGRLADFPPPESSS